MLIAYKRLDKESVVGNEVEVLLGLGDLLWCSFG